MSPWTWSRVTAWFTISFRTIKNATGGMGVFLMFGSLTLVALLYFWRKVLETKGMSF